MKDTPIERIVSMLEAATEEGRLKWERASDSLIYSDDLSSAESSIRIGILFRPSASVPTRIVRSLDPDVLVSGHYVLTFDELDSDGSPGDNIVRIDTKIHRDFWERIKDLFKQAQVSIDVPPESAERVIDLIGKLEGHRKG